MRRNIAARFIKGFCLLLCILLCAVHSDAQPVVKKYYVRDGRMVIELGRQITEKDLESFVHTFDLADLNLKNFFKTNNPDSLLKMGWLIEVNNKALLIISKPLFSFDVQGDPSERIMFPQPPSKDGLFPLLNTNVRFGVNKFRNKYPFRTDDSVVVFFLRNTKQAREVRLAGTFTNWQDGSFPMQHTDSGWIVKVKLGPGKHWYKFIIDGNWTLDGDNELRENDGRGNVNSVYYKTNTTFSLDDAAGKYKKVFLAGSFNGWKRTELLMERTVQGWQLPVYLMEGTHTYKFIADGAWMNDPKNAKKLPDGTGGFNSVIQLGKVFLFRLQGYTDARQVLVSGNFNAWKDDELYMQKVAGGWELQYVLAPGNYEYKFIVDRRWIADPANPLRGNDGNSFLIVQPNYTFRLKAPAAKKVNVAGDFNGWNPNSIPMQREGEYWVFSMYLGAGKHRYKFITDGEWIKDPGNKLWEQNEFGTGNSIVWIGQ